MFILLYLFQDSLGLAEPVAPVDGVKYVAVENELGANGGDRGAGTLAYAHVEIVQRPYALLNGFLRGPALLVFFHKTLHELRVDRSSLPKHSMCHLRRIDSLQTPRHPTADTHSLVEPHPARAAPAPLFLQA